MWSFTTMNLRKTCYNTSSKVIYIFHFFPPHLQHFFPRNPIWAPSQRKLFYVQWKNDDLEFIFWTLPTTSFGWIFPAILIKTSMILNVPIYYYQLLAYKIQIPMQKWDFYQIYNSIEYKNWNDQFCVENHYFLLAYKVFTRAKKEISQWSTYYSLKSMAE